MLLFEHKQYLQSYDTESSVQTEMLSYKRRCCLYNYGFNAYKNGW